MANLPPAPYEGEIPPGTIRLFHYTSPEHLDSIRQHGLLYSKGRGDSGTGADEPSKGVWASTRPKDDLFQYRPVVEYWAQPEQLSRNAEHYWHQDPMEWAASTSPHHVIMHGDVPPEQFVAVHEPWHTHYRYLMDAYPTPDAPHLAEMGGPTAFDWTMDPKKGGDPDLGRAVQEWKNTLWPPQPPQTTSKTASLYQRWVFSPATGQVQLADNSADALDVRYHTDLARDLNEPNLVHGYAYPVQGGWRLTDWESQPVEDPYVVAQVMRALKAEQSRRSEPWEPDYEEQWDRVHFGLPT